MQIAAEREREREKERCKEWQADREMESSGLNVVYSHNGAVKRSSKSVTVKRPDLKPEYQSELS
jgi:hypothetical protein